MATTYLVSSVSQTIVIGSGRAPMVYGTALPARTVRLGVETGHVPDLTTGMLGKGLGRIHGTVVQKGDPMDVPLQRRVRLVRERDGLVVRETWSDPATGAYTFDYIDELQTWTVVSYDHTRDKRAVIADGLTPQLIARP